MARRKRWLANQFNGQAIIFLPLPHSTRFVARDTAAATKELVQAGRSFKKEVLHILIILPVIYINTLPYSLAKLASDFFLFFTLSSAASSDLFVLSK